jgi:hypothetical protein
MKILFYPYFYSAFVMSYTSPMTCSDVRLNLYFLSLKKVKVLA